MDATEPSVEQIQVIIFSFSLAKINLKIDLNIFD